MVPRSKRCTLSRAIFIHLGITKTPDDKFIYLCRSCTVILDLIFIKPAFSYLGLADGDYDNTIYGSTVVLMFFSLRKKVGSFNGSAVVSTFLRSLIGSIVMSIVVILIYNNLVAVLGLSFIGECTSLAAAILGGIIVYIICMKILKVEEMKLVEDSVKNFFKR
ncbi:MAG: hypothetical protein ACLTAI_10580 [Thomasclavelia sp.]